MYGQIVTIGHQLSIAKGVPSVVKKIIIFFVEFILILFLGGMLLIFFTGGFSFTLGTLVIRAHSLKNPFFVFLIAVIFRKVLVGSFFHHFALLAVIRQVGTPLCNISDKLAGQFVESQRFRKGLTIILLLLFICTVLAAVCNPLNRGLIGHYYKNIDWADSPIMTTRDRILRLWRMKSEYPAIAENYSIEWTGAIVVPVSGEYQFTTISDDGSELHIDDQLVVDNRGLHGFVKQTGSIHLEEGFHSITIRYMQGGGAADFKAYWTQPGKAREGLSRAPLFTKKLTQMTFSIGRFLETLLIVCKFLWFFGVISFAWIGFCSRSILFPFLKSSVPGKIYRKYRSLIVKKDVEEFGVPSFPQKGDSIFLFAVVGYTFISLVWTYPLILHFTTKMIGLGGDRYIYIWNMWWMKKALLDLHTNPLYTDYVFYPQGLSLAFHDFSIFNSLISVPLQRLFTVEEIYSLCYLATFVFGGFGCFLLIRYLTGDHLAAFLSGLVFAFWGGRAYYVDHLSLASVQWFPYCALYLIKTLRESSYRNPLLAAIFLAINALSAWYYAIYMSLFVALFLLYSAWAERNIFFTRACLKRMVLIGVLFIVIMLPMLYPMMTDIVEGQEYMVSQVLTLEAASLNVLFFPNSNHGFLGKYVRYLYLKHGLPLQWGLAGGSFIGYTVLLLCIYTIFKLRHLKHTFWLIALIFFLVLSFGPHPLLFSKLYASIPLPHYVLRYIPVLKIIRIPVRFMVMVMFCCSVLTGYACWDIFRRLRIKKTVFCGLAVLILFEFFRFYYVTPPEKTPDFYKELGQDSETYAILELTKLMNWQISSVRSALFQISHGKKLFHGHASRISPATYRQAYAIYTVFDDLFTRPRKYLNQSIPGDFSLTTHKQTISELLSYYNVKYIALYYDYWHGDFQENRRRLQELFEDPVRKEQGIVWFKVEQVPVSESLIFPGFGMFPLRFREGEVPARQAARNADIKIINLNNYKELRIQFEGRSYNLPEEQVEIYVNDTLVSTETIGEDWTEVTLPSVAIKPEENTIHFRTLENGDRKYGIRLRNVKVDLL
jgi:hypothetical protein